MTFALADADDLEPLKIKSGKRFMAVLVEIGDDETPVQYPPGAVVPADKDMKPAIGPGAYWLVLRCREHDFWAFLNHEKAGDVTNAEDAALLVKFLLGVESRKEVDADPRKQRLFDSLIRHPYQKWLVRRSA